MRRDLVRLACMAFTVRLVGAALPSVTSSFLECTTVPRPNPLLPRATNIANMITSAAAAACSSLQTLPSQRIGTATFQGYVLYGGSDSGPVDVQLCQSALKNIANECILHDSTYGGASWSNQNYFNLTNMRGTSNPILSGVDAPASKETSVLTVPCAPTFPGSSQSCPPALATMSTITLATTAGQYTSYMSNTVSNTKLNPSDTMTRSGNFSSDSSNLSNSMGLSSNIFTQNTQTTQTGQSTNTETNPFSRMNTYISTINANTFNNSRINTQSNSNTAAATSQTFSTGIVSTSGDIPISTISSGTRPIATIFGLPKAIVTTATDTGTQAATGTGSTGTSTNAQTQASGNANSPVVLNPGLTASGITTFASVTLPSSIATATSGTAAALVVLPMVSSASSLFDEVVVAAGALVAAGATVEASDVTAFENVMLSTFTAAAGAMEAFEIIEPTLDPATKKLLQNTILPGLENLLDLLRDQFVDLAAYLQRKDISKLAKIAAALVAAKTILPPVLSAASSAFGNEPTGKPTVTSSVSSSSSSSSQNPTKTPWIISTKQGTAQSDFQDLIDSLGNPSDGVEIGYPNMPYQIYAASLNDSMAQRAASSKIVGTMELDTAAVNDSETIIPFNPSINKRDNQWFPGLVPTPADLEKRVGSTVQPPPTFSTSPAGDLGLVQQLKSPEQLKLISDPTGGQGQIDYTFEANPGASTYVYVIDTGVNKDHMDFRRKPVRTIPTTEGQDDIFGHGTRMCDLVGGAWAGSAKDTQVVSVKLNSNGNIGDPQVTKMNIAIAFNSIIAEVIAKNLQGHAVISLSLSWDKNIMITEFTSQAQEDDPLTNSIFVSLLRDAFRNGIVVVCAAGNQGKLNVDVMDRQPAGLARASSFPQLIVVGSIDASGAISAFTNKDSTNLITVYLNGEDVVAADFRTNDQWTQASGTSEATAMTAGLVAYLLGKSAFAGRFSGDLTQVAAEAKTLLQELAVKPNGFAIANNGELADFIGGVCALPPPQLLKRDQFELVTTSFLAPACSATGTRTMPQSISPTGNSGIPLVSPTKSPSGASSSVSTTPTTLATSSTKLKGSSTSTSVTPTGTLNCQQNIPTNGPSPSNVAQALTQSDGIASICGAKFDGSGDSTHMTLNVGLIDIALTRPSADRPLQFCTEAMNSIINVCILGSADYGGIWNLQGEVYNVTNMNFPNNPLIPGADDGAMTTTASPTTSTKPAIPPFQTATMNGEVCVLPYGSNDPLCTPTSTPAPNPDGTNLHVVSGCIAVNGSPRCADDSIYQSFYNVASTPNSPISQAIIYAKFDPNNLDAGNVQPGCELAASWPSNYGDVYFHEDNCLYDSGGNMIFNECCTQSTTDEITNPYNKPPTQTASNKEGSSICLSISGDVCRLAAQRYQDNATYTQYSSTVWPDSTGEDILNQVFPVLGAIGELWSINFGCSVQFNCDNDQSAYAIGMTGKQIKDAIAYFYANDGAKTCGSTDLSNNCRITINGCDNCQDSGGPFWTPAQVVDGDSPDANDGFS